MRALGSLHCRANPNHRLGSNSSVESSALPAIAGDLGGGHGCGCDGGHNGGVKSWRMCGSRGGHVRGGCSEGSSGVDRGGEAGEHGCGGSSGDRRCGNSFAPTAPTLAAVLLYISGDPAASGEESKALSPAHSRGSAEDRVDPKNRTL